MCTTTLTESLVTQYNVLEYIRCIYMKFADAIREGDGERNFRDTFILIFKTSQSKNYSCEAAPTSARMRSLLDCQINYNL